MRRVLQFRAYPEARAPEHLARWSAATSPSPTRARTLSSPYAWSQGDRGRRTTLTSLATPTSPGTSTSPAAPTSPAFRPGWTADPLGIGLALLLCPPVGVTLLWASPRHSETGKGVVTAFVAASMALLVLILRSS